MAVVLAVLGAACLAAGTAWQLAGRRTDRTLVGGSLLCVVGLAVFLLAAHPTSTTPAGTELLAIPPLVLTAVLAAAGAVLGCGGRRTTWPVPSSSPSPPESSTA